MQRFELSSADPRDPLAPAGSPRRDWLTVLSAPALCTGLLVVLLQVLLLGSLLWRYGVDVPLIDQWSLVEDLGKARAGEWGLAELWRSHNGHRILLPRVILVPTALLTGWNTRYEMVLSLLAACALFALLAWMALLALGARQIARYGLALAALATVVFSLSQWENWLWGIQLCVFLVVSCGVACLVALMKARLGALALLGAMLLALLATVSQAPGLVAWPVGAAILVWRSFAEGRKLVPATVAWCAVGLAVWVLYFLPAPGDATNPGDTSYVLDHPLRTLVFALSVVGAPVASFTGSPWPPDPSVTAPIAGALALGVTAVLAWSWLASDRGQRSRAVLPIAVCAFALSSAALVALGRASMGAPAAMASRYITLMTPFWAVHLVFVVARGWPGGGDQRPGLGAIFARAWTVAVVGGLTASSLASLAMFPSRHTLLVPARQALYEGGPRELLQRLHPEVDQQVIPQMSTLARLRLSVFRDRDEVPAPEPIEGLLTDFRQELRALTTLPDRMAPGEIVRLPIELGNPTAETWSPMARSPNGVNLSYRWLDASTGTVVVRDGHRSFLEAPLEAGQSVVLEAVVQAPESPGAYRLRMSAVQEGVAWFSDRGAPALEHSVEVIDMAPPP